MLDYFDDYICVSFSFPFCGRLVSFFFCFEVVINATYPYNKILHFPNPLFHHIPQVAIVATDGNG